MDTIQQFKEKVINNYLSSIDMTSKFLDRAQIIRDLKNELGEEPAIQFNYKKEQSLNETTGEEISTEKLESMTIIFTVDRELIHGQTSPMPVSQTFIIG